MTVLGTPDTPYWRDRSGNSVASIAVALMCGLAAASRYARPTAWGQNVHVGVTKTLISTGRSSAAIAVRLVSLSPSSRLPTSSTASTSEATS